MLLSSDSLTHEQSGKFRLRYGVVNALGIYLRLVQINPTLQYSSMDTYFATVCMRKLLRNARRQIEVVGITYQRSFEHDAASQRTMHDVVGEGLARPYG